MSAPRRFVEFSAAAQHDLRSVLLLLGLNFDAVHSLLAEQLPSSPADGGVPAVSTHVHTAIVRVEGDRDEPGVLANLLEPLEMIAEKDLQAVEVQRLTLANVMGMTNMHIRLAYGSPRNPQQCIDDHQPVKELVFRAKSIDFRADFDLCPYAPPPIFKPKKMKDAKVTLLQEPEISIPALRKVFGIFQDFGLNCLAIKRLSTSKLSAVQLTVEGGRGLTDEAREKLMELNAEGLDIAVTTDNLSSISRRVIVFDMDSTLIQGEVIDELAKIAGCEAEVSKVTAAAMGGQMEFAESLRRRVACLKGNHAPTMYDIVKRGIVFMPGAKELCSTLKHRGYKMAVISGGFLPIARYVQKTLQLDYAFANNLQEDADGNLTGATVGPVVTPQRKRTLMQMIADVEGCHVDQVIAVGDGANDIPMLKCAGLGVAFCAKPMVQKKANHRINQKDLRNIAYLVGMKESQIHKRIQPKASNR